MKLNYEMNKLSITNCSLKDIERLKKYKSDTIFMYAKNLSDAEKNKINNYIESNVLNYINKYKNVVLNNIIVGSFLVRMDNNILLLDEIYIEKTYRNKNIATRVIKNIIDNIKEDLFLYVYKDNIRAISLYKKIGFIVKCETETRLFMVYKK